MTGTASFFHTMTPYLVANLLTVTFVYAWVAYTRHEQEGGKLHLLWLGVLPLLFALYGLYLWGVYPLKKHQPPIAHQLQQPDAASASDDPLLLGHQRSSE
jgi:hypothetical protein